MVFDVIPPLELDLNPLLQDYMSQKSISLLLEKKSIFIGKENVDITNDMLELINNNFK